MNIGDIHPKVGVGVIVGSIVSFVLAIVKLKWGLDLSGQETNLVVIATALAGYFTSSTEVPKV